MPVKLYKKLVNAYFFLNRYFNFKFLPEGYKAFDFIYKENYWKKGSGHGSSPEVTVEYRSLLEKIIVEYDIKTIVDFGCGDWQFSRYIDWHGAKYLGYDVVKSVIDRNIELYAKPEVRFLHLPPEDMDNIEEADLYIAKEVFQHLPNAEVQRLLNVALVRYKYLLITNNVPSTQEGENSLNKDIAFGYWRCLDVTKPPFSLDACFSQVLIPSPRFSRAREREREREREMESGLGKRIPTPSWWGNGSQESTITNILYINENFTRSTGNSRRKP